MKNRTYRVLFVCVHNSGRSQIAEAAFNSLIKSSRVGAVAESAGTVMAGQLNPAVCRAMAELGVSLEGQHPKQLTSAMLDRADRVVSMGCGVDSQACPTKFVATEDWGLDDPAGQPDTEVRRVRDEVFERVRRLIASLENE